MEYICKSCGHVGKPTTIALGSTGLEAILWLLGIFTLVFLPVALIYSFWRLGNKKQVCKKCKDNNIIPINSPIGKRLLEVEKQIKTL